MAFSAVGERQCKLKKAKYLVIVSYPGIFNIKGESR